MNTPSTISFLYRFELGNGVTYLYTNASKRQTVDGENYEPLEIEHTAPTFSGEAEDAEIDIAVKQTIPVADYYLLAPPPFQTKVTIYEYDVDSGLILNDDYYKGWIVRGDRKLQEMAVEFHVKSLWMYFERETMADSLASLSRFSIYDPRSGADLESLRTSLTVDSFNDQRDVIAVSGLSNPAGWFTGGILEAPNGDQRTIILDETISGTRYFTLSGAFDSQTLDVSFSADAFPGDDLTYETWATKFDAQTHSGRDFGGWPYMPTLNPDKRGIS